MSERRPSECSIEDLDRYNMFYRSIHDGLDDKAVGLLVRPDARGLEDNGLGDKEYTRSHSGLITRSNINVHDQTQSTRIFTHSLQHFLVDCTVAGPRTECPPTIENLP